MWSKRLKSIELEAKSEVKNGRGSKQLIDSREESKNGRDEKKKTVKEKMGRGKVEPPKRKGRSSVAWKAVDLGSRWIADARAIVEQWMSPRKRIHHKYKSNCVSFFLCFSVAGLGILARLETVGSRQI